MTDVSLSVAAELRRMAVILDNIALYEEGAGESYGLRLAVQTLNDRANDYDPQGLTKIDVSEKCALCNRSTPDLLQFGHGDHPTTLIAPS